LKLKQGIPEAVSPAEILVQTDAVSSGVQPPNFGLYARIGSPVKGQWLISNRLPDAYLQELAKSKRDHPEIHLQQYIVLTYRDEVARLQAESRLRSDPSVASVRPNTMLELSARANDYFADLTYAWRVPQGYQWALESIRAMSLASNPTGVSGWDYSKGWGFVGVVDSGVDATHPDLQGRIRQHFSQAFYTGCAGNPSIIDEAGSPLCPNNASSRGHGTHVAGLVAAIADNSIGVSGVCHFCSLIIAKVYNNNSLATSDVVNGINHSVIRGAGVVNISSGAQNYTMNYGTGIFSCAQIPAGIDGYCDVLALAELRQVVVVAASGNHNNVVAPSGGILATQFPASEPNVVSVGGLVFGDSLWQNDNVPGIGPTQGSNIDKIEFLAGAKRVVSTFYRGSTYYYRTWCSDTINDVAYYPNGFGYDECTGTSMSAPIVTGAVALSRSLDPLRTRMSLVNVMRTTARSVASGVGVTPDLIQSSNTLANGNASLTPLFAFVVPGIGFTYNRFYSVFPQMGTAAIKGTLLPLPNSSTTPVYYTPDENANLVSSFPAFPDVASVVSG